MSRVSVPATDRQTDGYCHIARGYINELQKQKPTDF